ncbi:MULTISPECIES: hypothetical protein [unclassified Methylobacterium]|uniref:hypothetical protein n=1 Tax=unclassified Methylobacterium TaxID=2615210 RepID=UPI0013542DB9|nr:hypothetical protein [Methylobacterium sp. 2A]MWV21963.1 hypothetical protein [Methylobacterium sp. 2A]
MHNLTPAVMWETMQDLTRLGFAHAVEIGLAHTVIINSLGGDFWANECTSFGDKQPLFAKKSDVIAIHLAHMIWKLKSAAGFESFIKRAKLKDFEGAYYELYTANLFAKVADHVDFVVPTNARGSDFDLKVYGFLEKPILNVEVKARNKTLKSPKRVIDFLKDAKSQLAKGEPGSIVFKVQIGPDSISQAELNETIARFIKSTSRVDFVTYVWDASKFQNSLWMSHQTVDGNGVTKNVFAKDSLIVPSFFVDAQAYGSCL